MDDLDDFRQLAGRWEAHAAKLPPGDRYRAGLDVCAEQLREIITRAWLADAGRLEGQLEVGDVDDPDPDAQGGMSQFGALPVVDDDDDSAGRFLS